jgi:hypothetical protein
MIGRFPFSWLAAGLGLFLALVLLLGGGADPAAARGLPLLTRLLISEFGFLLTAGGAFWGFKTWRSQGAKTATLIAAIACVALALGFSLIGLILWIEGIGPAQASLTILGGAIAA